jgi:WD40 repeat protein
MRPIQFVAAAVACAVGTISYPAAAQPTSVLRPSETIKPQAAAPQQKPPVITAVAVVSGGESIATAGDDHAIRLWSSTSGKLVRTLKGHADWVRALAFSPDGATLASAGDDHSITLWEVTSGNKLAKLNAHPHVVYTIAFSPDGKQLAAAGFERTVRVYDVAERKLSKELEGPDVDLRAVAFSPDGTRLAVAGRNGQVRGWNLATAKADLEIPAVRIGRLRALAWLPDGQKLVTAGENKLLSVWDARTGQALKQMTCQTGKLLSMVVCSDELIATGGSDNVIRVWNWQSETEADTLVGHTGSVASLAFDASSRTIISGSFDTTVRVWKLKQLTPEAAGRETAEVGEDSRVR